MTKQRKHKKRSTIKKKMRRMRQNADKHSKVASERSRMLHDYAPYKVGESRGGWDSK